MSATEIIMRPLMPGNAGLESIGSVAANFARQNAERDALELIHFKNDSPRSSLSESILSMYGQLAYDENVAWERATAEKAQREDEQRRAFRARLLRRPRKCCRLLRKSWKRAFKQGGYSSLVGETD